MTAKGVAKALFQANKPGVCWAGKSSWALTAVILTLKVWSSCSRKLKCDLLLLGSVLVITYWVLQGEGRNICAEPSYLNLAECLPAIKSPLNSSLLCCVFSFVKVIMKAGSLAEFGSFQEAHLGSGNVHKAEM